MRASRILLFLLVVAVLTATSVRDAVAQSVRPADMFGKQAADSPNIAAVSAEIRARVSSKLKPFYERHTYRPLWAATGSIGPAADLLLNLMATANLDGLNPPAYGVSGLRRAIEEARSGDPRAVAKAELKISKTFTRYVSDMRRASKAHMIYVDPALAPKKLTPDGILGAASLSQPLDDYIATMGWMSPHYVQQRKLLASARQMGSAPDILRRIQINLDRARELPSPWTQHVVVDSASGRLWYYEAGRLAGTMRVVVGKPASPTPMLVGMLRYAILNPYWNIPVDLAQNLIAPKILKGRTLASMQMEALSDWSETAQRLDPKKIDWTAVASGAQPLRLRQLPGATNSMGRVKFMFPNEYGIYLHDTPEKELLAKDDRHFSNGCIRLEDAPRLGKWLLGAPIVSNIRKPEQAVGMSLPVPVYLTYLTSTASDQGVTFLNDVYGRDK